MVVHIHFLKGKPHAKLKKMIKQKWVKKIWSISKTVIVIFSGLVTILDWLGIHFPEKLLGKAFKLLFFRVPIIWVIFFFSITIFYLTKRRDKEISPVKIEDKPKEDMKLTEEHHCVLLTLLGVPDCKCKESDLEVTYKEALGKNTSDFNILKQELLDADLIFILKSYYGPYWKLTGKGLKTAGAIHKSSKGIKE